MTDTSDEKEMNKLMSELETLLEQLRNDGAKVDIYDLPPEEAAEVPKTPASLDAALTALERDHDFLLRGDVFTEDVIATWIGYKRENEVDALRLRPHPYEFCLYYDI